MNLWRTGGWRRARLVAGIGLGVALLAGAFLLEPDSVDGGGRTLEGWCAAQLGFALILATLLGGAGLPQLAWFGSIFLLGTAAQLALISPKWLQYFEIRPARILSDGVRLLACAGIAFQVLVVAVGLRRHGLRPLGDLRPFLTRRLVVGGGILFLLASAHFTLFYPHRTELVWLGACIAQILVAFALMVLNLSHLWLVARSLPAERAVRLRDRFAGLLSLPGSRSAERPLDRHVPWILAGFVLVAAVAICWFALDRVPHVPDGIAYLFHAKFLAAGLLSAPAPPVPEAFTVYLIDFRDGQWLPTTNPGYPAVLALGVLAGVPWLVNPILGALCVLLLHSLLRTRLDLGAAHLGAALLALSPWFLALSASFMTHVLLLALMLAGWRILVLASDRRSFALALAAGAAIGLMVPTRPLDGLAVGVLTGLWLLLSARPGAKVLLAYSAGCVVGSIWWLGLNAAYTGSPFLDPLNRYVNTIWYAGANRMGFGPDVGNPPGGWGILDPIPGHGWRDVVLNTNQNVYNLNFELFGWPIGSLFLATIHLLRGKLSRLDRHFVVFTLALVAGYSCYWFSGGPDYGPRYWFLLIAPLVWWSVRGVSTVIEVVAASRPDSLAGPRLGAVGALLTAVVLFSFLPWRGVAKYSDYRSFHGEYLRLREEGRFGRALVLIRETGEDGKPNEKGLDYSSAFLLNSPELRTDEPVFARDLGPESNRRLMDAFPDRPVIRVLGRGPGVGRVQVQEEIR